MNTALKIINPAVTFLLELAMLGSLGYYGMNQPWDLLPRMLFSAVLIVVIIALWARYAAPKSKKRLPMPYQALFRIILFLLASFLLFQSGPKTLSLIFATLAVLTQTISYFMEK